MLFPKCTVIIPTDILRNAVPPPATQSFRDTNISPYNEMQYLGNSEMRMYAVDETLSRMKLQGNPMMGPASDLQTFIR
jgi:recombining binding protein (suppressor of hairless)